MLALAAIALTIAATPSVESAAASYQQGLMHRDDAALARSDFRDAAAQYEALWVSGIRSPALAAQRGQAHFLADQYPQALRAYHEGLQLAPDDACLHEGLSQTRAMFADVPRVERWRWWISPWWFVGMAYIASWFAWWRGRRRQALTLALLMLTGIVAIAWMEARRQLPRIVIVAQSTWCRQGNAESYPTRGDSPLSVGSEVRLRGRRGGWAQVEFNDGERGWLNEAQLLLERPRESATNPVQ